MSWKEIFKHKWTMRIVIVAAIVLFAWEMVGLHVDEPSGFVLASKAQSFASIPIPPEARNIRIAGNRQWIEYAKYVRFEAPVAVCMKTAASIVPGQKLEPVDQWELDSRRDSVRPGVFKNFSWFDLSKASHVISAKGGHHEGSVWVNQDRGVFYYLKTD